MKRKKRRLDCFRDAGKELKALAAHSISSTVEESSEDED